MIRGRGISTALRVALWRLGPSPSQALLAECEELIAPNVALVTYRRHTRRPVNRHGQPLSLQVRINRGRFDVMCSALWKLQQAGQVEYADGQYRLTAAGESLAKHEASGGHWRT